MLGHTIVSYIDDTLLSQSQSECDRAITDTKNLFEELGFIVHPRKLILKAIREIIFLSFIINVMTMTVKSTPENCVELKMLCTRLCNKQNVKIQDVALVTGEIVAIFPGAQYGPLHYRVGERQNNSQTPQGEL